MFSNDPLSAGADDLTSTEAALDADDHLDRYLDSYLEAAMDLPRIADLPRLGEHLSPSQTESSTTQLPVRETSPLPGRSQFSAEPLPAWLRGDEKLGADDYQDEFDADDDHTEPAVGLRGLRWIRKNMSSFKVTVSLQRPTPAPGKPRRPS